MMAAEFANFPLITEGSGTDFDRLKSVWFNLATSSDPLSARIHTLKNEFFLELDIYTFPQELWSECQEISEEIDRYCGGVTELSPVWRRIPGAITPEQNLVIRTTELMLKYAQILALRARKVVFHCGSFEGDCVMAAESENFLLITESSATDFNPLKSVWFNLATSLETLSTRMQTVKNEFFHELAIDTFPKEILTECLEISEEIDRYCDGETELSPGWRRIPGANTPEQNLVIRITELMLKFAQILALRARKVV